MQLLPFFARVVALLFTLFPSAMVFAADMQLDMTPGVTAVSQQVFDLHRIILWICVATGVVVFGLMFWSIFHHRRSKGVKPADFHESTLIEILWTLIPFVILVAMAVPATRVLIAMSDTSKSDLTVRVTGSQWKWNYEYLTYGKERDLGLSFFSVLSTPKEQIENKAPKGEHYLVEVDKPLVIPTGKKVRFLLTSEDVIHAWWVPAFAIKRDAVPGYINEVWTEVPAGKEGLYRGRCAELCGKDHAFMPIEVKAVAPKDFEVWLADARKKAEEEAKAAAASVDYKFPNLAEAMKVGEEVYNGKCAVCHQVDGSGMPPAFPALKGGKIAADKTKLGEHVAIVVGGKNAMPAWKGQLTPKEMAAVITYERNAWGNNTGDLVQPAQVAK